MVTDREGGELRTGCESGKLEKLPRRRDSLLDTTKYPFQDGLTVWVSKLVVGVFFENSIVCRWIVSANLGAVSVTVTKPHLG